MLSADRNDESEVQEVQILSPFQIGFNKELESSLFSLSEYNKSVVLLQNYIQQYRIDQNDCLEFLYESAVLNTLAEKHYDKGQPAPVAVNRLMSLVTNLGQLASVIPVNISDQTQQEIFFDVLNQGIDLTRLLTERYNHFRMQASIYRARDYEDAMQQLGEVIQMTADMVSSNLVNAPKMNNFIASVTKMQNLIEVFPDRFLREHPYITAFVSAALIAVGTCLFIAGILLLPVASPIIFAAIVATTLTGILVASVGASVLLTQAFERFFLRNQDQTNLVEQTSKTVSSLKSLTTSSAAFFSPEKPGKSILSSSSSSSAAPAESLTTSLNTVIYR